MDALLLFGISSDGLTGMSFTKADQANLEMMYFFGI